MVKARSIGTGVGAFFNNPGVIILGALAVILLFFRGDIRNAFGSLGQGITEGLGGLGDININLPEFNFPDITFPSFDFGGLFQGFNPFPNAILTPEGDVAVIPLGEPGAAINPADQPTNPTPVDIALSEDLPLPPLTPEEIALDPNQDPSLFQPPAPPEGDPAFVGPVQPFQLPPIVSETPSVILEDFAQDPSQLNIGQEQPLTEAPLGALPLSQIIDKFMVTASQAANIKFIAQQGGDPFATPENIFGENPPAVTAGLGFEGLTPEQIFEQISGGVISNF